MLTGFGESAVQQDSGVCIALFFNKQLLTNKKIMKQFEYTKYADHKEMSTPEMNNLGDRGWELVSYIRTKLQGDTNSSYHEYIFKREKK